MRMDSNIDLSAFATGAAIAASIFLGAVLASNCGAAIRPPSGSAICVDMTDAGPQATVSSGGITIVVPLMKLTIDGGP